MSQGFPFSTGFLELLDQRLRNTALFGHDKGLTHTMNQDISTFDGVDDMLDTGVLFKNAVQDGFTHTIGHVELKVLGLQSACKNRSNRIGLELDAIPQPTTGRTMVASGSLP